MTDREKDIALREAAHIAASDEYFKARPNIDSNDRRRVFEAGFNRAWGVQGGELERLKDLLRNNFTDDHLRIEFHFYVSRLKEIEK